jgi:hypothetical protein
MPKGAEDAAPNHVLTALFHKKPPKSPQSNPRKTALNAASKRSARGPSDAGLSLKPHKQCKAASCFLHGVALAALS